MADRRGEAFNSSAAQRKMPDTLLSFRLEPSELQEGARASVAFVYRFFRV